jgi:hypothetical protein
MAATLLLPDQARGTAALPCIPRNLDWLRADTAGWVIGVARGDSAIAGTWDRPAWWDSTRQDTAGPRRLDIYGQWATIERASDVRDVGRRALFVLWHTGGMCERIPSRRALAFPVGARFFAGGSLRERNRRGTSIHDIAVFTPRYVPASMPASSPGNPPLTVEEYATFYAAMPTQAQWFADPLSFTRGIRAWARANPSLAGREPVLGALALMEVDYAITMDEKRREGAWPRDSLIQEPGLLLRRGMQLLYRGEGEQLWTIDSLSPDTTLAGVPHCVRMRLRTSPQSPAATRAFCARGGVLHSYDDAGAQLRPVRPLLPGNRLTTRGANGTTSLFVTDSLDVVIVHGRAVEVIGTTVTISDSTGRPVRRLRERFAPALLTATEGSFEVPDATQAGTWRIVARFSLTEIRPWP